MSDASERDLPMRGERKIRCPKCDYKPRAEDRWACIRSQRPLAVLSIQCPACGQVSPHRQWYREPERTVEEERERVLEPEGA